MTKDKTHRFRSSKTIMAIILTLAFIEMVFVFCGNNLARASSSNLQSAYNNQLKYRTMANQLKETSDYLSNEVRMYAVTGDMSHFMNYWNEVKNEMHREKVIDELEKMNLPSGEKRYLERAKYFSDTLMHIEISSMRLKLESGGEASLDESGYMYSYDDKKSKKLMDNSIAYVKYYNLERDFLCDTTEQKAQKSIQILYGTSYMAYKDLIDGNIAKFQDTMNLRLDGTVDNAKKESDKAFMLLTIMGIAELVILISIMLIFQKWFINPVVKYKKLIERQHGRRRMFVEPEGVWELQQFANEFNALSSDMLSELAKSERIENELTEAKAKAEEASNVKSQFLTQMSHELRTPLNAISGYLYLLGDTRLSGEQHRYVDNMQLATDVLLEEINEILDYSKLESGKMRFEDKNFNLPGMTESLRGMLENEAGQRKLDFDIIVDERVPDYLYGDPLRLKQVLTNLLYNSFKFTKEGSVRLVIKGLDFSKSRCVLEFAVEDTGIGVKKDKQQSIFKAFTQADESITRKYGGTGLGLPICRRLVEEMSHGRYSLLLESEYGKGSRFYFDMEFGYGRRESKVRHTGNTLNRKKKKVSILIVDDNKINLILEAELLHKFGYNAQVESDPAKVIDKMKREHFDIVFLDISMPVLSGYELAGLIRKNPQFDKTVLIALSANIGDEVAQKVKESGMDDYLPKPIPVDELNEKLEKYTDSFDNRSKINGYLTKTHSKAALEENEAIEISQLENQFYGDSGAVKELFDIFVEDNETFSDKINSIAKKDVITDKDLKMLEQEIHRLKGVSGNLMCKKLAKATAICLKDVQEGKTDSEHIDSMCIKLDEVIHFMKSYIGDVHDEKHKAD
ncbi:ATP-binding protein [Agathobacter sp.]|uniref:ATP-binding protein n=1 Tax=Agathobacter sp. TaxID=2021311 RepID=UPI003FD7E397